eukprot:PhM_4_TR14733/c0_g2_i1/m.66489/K12197/CHMP1, VPS46, DID2; charged multivesicular body protein 1
MSSLDQLQKVHFNLKFVSKQFGKNSKKCEKEEKQERDKCRKAMEKGNMDGARIYAQNAIRKKNEALNFLRLSARMDGVASRLDTAIKMRSVTKSMGQMVKGMDTVLNAMNPDQISRLMEKFESQFENMDVMTQCIDGAMSDATALTTPEDEVSSLMQQVADAHGLDVKQQLGPVRGGALPQQQKEEAVAEEQTPELADLSSRLAALKR